MIMIYEITTKTGEIYLQQRGDAMPLPSFKRSCIIKYGAIKKIRRVS